MTREIVIVGGGIGGARIAKILAEWHEGQKRNIHITVIDKSRYHTFYSNLYEVATAYLPEAYGQGPMPLDFFDLKSSAIYPLDDIFLNELNVSILEAEVTGIDFKKHEINLKNHKPKEYDILVLAAGSETNYFGMKGLIEQGLPLKNFFHALNIRNAVDEAFANAPKNKPIKIVIGGGGFTGCELAAELIGYCNKLSYIHGRPHGNFECLIVEAAETLLGGGSAWLQRHAMARLEKLGVKFKFKSPIKDIIDKEIILDNKEKIYYDVLIWTAGVMANSLTHSLPDVTLEHASCLRVDKMMRILPHENVFGAGDNTYCIDEATGKSMPMTASVAIREAKYVAENIKRTILKKPLIDYKPHFAGFIIPLGGKHALLESGGLRLNGYFAWLIKEFVSLHYWASLVGWPKAWSMMRKGMKVYTKND